MRDVSGVVDADADADDEQRARYRVHGDVCDLEMRFNQWTTEV